MQEVKNILKNICDKHLISFSSISKDYVYVLEKDQKIRYIKGYKFGLNDHALGLILDDKYATYELLKLKTLKVIDHNIVYGKDNFNNYAIDINNYNYVKQLFFKYNNDIVMKPNEGTCGTNVYHITKISDLEEKYNLLMKNNFSISICPYCKIKNEFRIIVLCNEPKLIYKKIKPIIIGDGKSTIKELLIKFNKAYFINKNIKDRVLFKNEEYEYDWKFNLSCGAKLSEDIDVIDKEFLLKYAKEIANKIDLKFGSIDIIKTDNNEFYILEINSGVMLKSFIKQADNGYDRACSLYEETIMKLFEKE